MKILRFYVVVKEDQTFIVQNAFHCEDKCQNVDLLNKKQCSEFI